ncbi:MAG: beta-propeller fold lactonase family protein [Pseudobdellovibrio sp.]
MIKQLLPYFISLSLITLLFNCSPKEFPQNSFAPANIVPLIKGVTANGGGALYCSISGGCSLTVTGSQFYTGARVFIGPYECLNAVVSSSHTSIDCTVGAGKTGVYDVSVVNADNKSSQFDPSVSNTSVLNFSYASFLYVGVQNNPGKVYGYAQNPQTGALLSIVGSPFTTGGNQTYGTVISPNNKFLYAANVAAGTVSAFKIDSVTGKLTSAGVDVSSGAASPNGLFFHPSGHYLYVTNQGGNSVSAFSVAGDGTLTSVSGSPFSAGSASLLNGIVVHPSGNFVYVASMGGSGGVVGYSVVSGTGALNLLAGSPYSNANGGINNTGDGITIHPNGQWLYMGLVNQKRVSAFQIDTATGDLTGLGTPVLNNNSSGYVDNGGSGANISPDGLFFYGTAFSTTSGAPAKVISYAIDPVSGTLTLSSEADAGGGPNDVRIDTNGLFAYTCNSANSPSVSAFSRNTSTGVLTPLTVRDYAIPTSNYGPGIMVIQK